MSSTITGSDLLHIETVCDRFERDRRAGRPHPLEKYSINKNSSRSEISLLKELLKVEWDCRAERGEHPKLEEYQTRKLLPTSQLQQVFLDWSNHQSIGALAHFRLLEKLGAGSFGVVWRALDTKLNRQVALKLAHLSLQEDSARFFRESKTASALNHPNIVRILEAGELEGRLFITREFVDGQSLAQYLKHDQLTPVAAATLCLKIAMALEYSHNSGCIHRDIKPQNILLDERLEPFLTDFGLAKSESVQTTATRSGTILGTPVYMSPEQAKGTGNELDGRMDIYSLGVVLFQMLTGEPPFRGNFEMVLLQVLRNEPPSPTKLNPAVPQDLATICLKCIEKEAAKRYQTASELIGDLRRFIENKPISANPIGRLERIRRTARQNPIGSLLVGMLLLSTLIILAGSIMAAVKFRRAWQQEVRLREEANSATQNAKQSAELAHTEAKLATDVTNFLNSVFSKSDFLGSQLTNDTAPIFPQKEVTASDLLNRAAARINTELESQPRVQARLMDIIGNVYRSRGKLNFARDLFDKAVHCRIQLRKEKPNLDLSLDEAEHLLFVGLWHKTRGEFEVAKTTLEQAHHQFESILPNDDIRISEAIFQLGWLHLEHKEPDTARVHFNEALRLRKTYLADNLRAINSCHVAILFCDINSNQFDLHNLVRRGREMFPDSETSQLLGDILVMMAARSAKLYGIAENKYRPIVRQLAKHLGTNDPLYILILGDFADLLYRAGKYNQAFPTIIPAIEVGERLAPEHPHLIEAYRTIGKEMYWATRFQDAIPYLERVVECKQLNTMRRRESKYLLVESFIETGQLSKAKKWFDVNEEIVGLELMSWRAWLGCRIAKATNDDVEFKRHSKQLKDYLPNIKRPHQAASWTLRFGDINRFLGNLKTAESDYRRAIEKERRNQPNFHPRIGLALLRLASLLDQKALHVHDSNLDSEIRALATEAQKIFRKNLPAQDPRIDQTEQLLKKWAKNNSGRNKTTTLTTKQR